MASALIYATRSTTQEQPNHRRIAEDAAQTFVDGVPVTVNTATGGVIEWNGVTPITTNFIAGVSKENASNLSAVGLAKVLTYGGPIPNQPLAIKIPQGAPFNDGRVGFDSAVPSTIFHGQVGPAQTTVATDVGKQYGMTKDTDGHWFVDKTKSGTSAVVTIEGLDQFDVLRGVTFTFLAAAQQQIV